MSDGYDEDDMKAYQHGKPIISRATTKICKECLVEKVLSKIVKDKNRKDGYKNTCKDCDNAVKRAAYKAKLENPAETIDLLACQILSSRWLR